MKLATLVTFYQQLTPDDVSRFAEFYTDDAYFKDPFNEVRSVAAIQRIFGHMFRQVAEPRFVVTETMAAADSAMLVWEFHFRMRAWRKDEAQIMRGVSHLRFAPDGRVCYHRDYWDSGEELYMKLPAIGSLMRGLRKALSP
jgi:ketosteroid isomerase-like protein